MCCLLRRWTAVPLRLSKCPTTTTAVTCIRFSWRPQRGLGLVSAIFCWGESTETTLWSTQSQTTRYFPQRDHREAGKTVRVFIPSNMHLIHLTERWNSILLSFKKCIQGLIPVKHCRLRELILVLTRANVFILYHYNRPFPCVNKGIQGLAKLTLLVSLLQIIFVTSQLN